MISVLLSGQNVLRCHGIGVFVESRLHLFVGLLVMRKFQEVFEPSLQVGLGRYILLQQHLVPVDPVKEWMQFDLKTALHSQPLVGIFV